MDMKFLQTFSPVRSVNCRLSHIDLNGYCHGPGNRQLSYESPSQRVDSEDKILELLFWIIKNL